MLIPLAEGYFSLHLETAMRVTTPLHAGMPFYWINPGWKIEARIRYVGSLWAVSEVVCLSN